MIVTLPPGLESRLDEQVTALHLAIGPYVSDEATLGQAAETAGISQSEFLHQLGDRRIPIHYGEDDLAVDLQAVTELTGK